MEESVMEKSVFETYLGEIEIEIRESLTSCYTNDQIDLFFTHLDFGQFPLTNLKPQRDYKNIVVLIKDFLNECKSRGLIELRMVFYELYRNNRGQYSLEEANNKLRIRQFEVFDLCFNIEARLNKLQAQLKAFRDIGSIPKNYDLFQLEIVKYSEDLTKLKIYKNKSDSELMQDYDNVVHIYINALKYYKGDLREWVTKGRQEANRAAPFYGTPI